MRKVERPSPDGSGPRRLASVRVPGGIEVADLDTDSVIEVVARLALASREYKRPHIATALHVGGLNSLGDQAYRDALSESDLVYADGVAVVAVAKVAGATRITRSATTDIGEPALARIAAILERTVRVAGIGGPPGLAESALATLQARLPIEAVYSASGYQNDIAWGHVLEDLKASRPDVLILGLGAPRELTFARERLTEFPPCLILTCGGWFGFITGEEKRASSTMQRLGLEWTHRLARDPARLGARYARGLFTTVRFLILAMQTRGGQR